jgi:hypothetical protein
MRVNKKHRRSGFSRDVHKRKRKSQNVVKATCCGLRIACRFAHHVNNVADAVPTGASRLKAFLQGWGAGL